MKFFSIYFVDFTSEFHQHNRFGSTLYMYTVSQKKTRHYTLVHIASPNIDRFSKFFHRQTPQGTCNKAILKIVYSLDFVVNRLFMKLFKTSNIDTVNYCCTEFQFELPCIVLEKRRRKFLAKYRLCENVYCKFV